MRCLQFVFCSFVLLVPFARGQDQTPQVVKIDLANCVTLTEGVDVKGLLSVELPQMERRTVTKSVPVQKTRQEVRSRIATVDGVPQEQTYVVTVPYTEIVTQAVSVAVPGEPRVVSLSLDDVDAWDKSGSRISSDQLKAKLARKQPAIMLDKAWPKGGKIPAAQLAVLKDDIVFVYSEGLGKRERRGGR